MTETFKKAELNKSTSFNNKLFILYYFGNWMAIHYSVNKPTTCYLHSTLVIISTFKELLIQQKEGSCLPLAKVHHEEMTSQLQNTPQVKDFISRCSLNV